MTYNYILKLYMYRLYISILINFEIEYTTH